MELGKSFNYKGSVSIRKSRLTSKDTAQLIAELAHDNKIEDVVILDMRKIVNFCDYFVIGTGSSDRRIRGAAENIQEDLKKSGIKVFHTQGFKKGNWVLLDIGDVVIHIFDAAMREFYGLEYLWHEAKRVDWTK